MSDRIPRDLLIEILIQCQIPTILRCRCVSKQWRALIDDPQFIKQHTDYAIQTNASRIFFNELFGNLCSSPLDTLEIRNVPIISQVQPVSLVGSCNGLLCLRNVDTQDICIMNPATRKHMYLQNLLPNNCRDEQNKVSLTGYGFGYDCVNDDYKVVRIAQKIDAEPRINNGNLGFLETEMSICNVKTRVLKVVKMPYFTLVNDLGVLACGALHWLMGKYNDVTSLKKKLIVGYDLGTDEFRELSQPEFLNHDNCRKNIGLLGTWLCLSANYNPEEGIDFWVMKEYGDKESWTMLFSFPITFIPCRYVRPLGLLERGSLVVLEVNARRLVWYDRKERNMRIFYLKARDECSVCLSSLTPLPSNENGRIDEKNQGSEDQMKTRQKKKKKDDFLSKGFKLKL
ncbi:F-box protein CPR1 [Ricinus communis]|uniref:F-box protein CPR1 n=1 Tax=Ricinus communis TaxID=3988 RepID=UPI00201B3090|nr:F-box protein CPR1 [Ricinus communis]